MLKAPFPWFGGKSRVASQVWQALGDCQHYCEPFFGSGAVLLGRPHWHKNNTETINDADSYVCNFWRALSADPDTVAYYADQPVNETDLIAIHYWLITEGKQKMIAGLESDPDYFDAQIAGRWVYGLCAWIGSGWCSGNGPWQNVNGKLEKVSNATGLNAQPHHPDNAGQGVNRQRPHLGNAGQGVSRKLPHLGDAGQGINRQLPHLSNAGQGVNRKLPHLGDAGKGINRKRPHLGDAGKGVNRTLYSQASLQNNNSDSDSFLPVNSALYSYMRQLAARLRNVRVCNGDWSRVVTTGALTYGSTVGLLLDPPYSFDANRDMSLYTHDSGTVAHDVREWAIANGDNPRYHIVLCGYSNEHANKMPDSWRVHSYSAGKAYGTSNGGGRNTENRHHETLWFSPHCMKPTPDLFSLAEEEVEVDI
ncbi:MAG: hypothetical protein DDT21_01857 [Syntrophomonadaceae bacterium]|nr:hypothetical protein [Bacillota bacterium]